MKNLSIEDFGFIIFVILLVVLIFFCIFFSIIREKNISKVPIKFGCVVSMSLKDYRGIIPRDVPTVKIACDVIYEEKLYTYYKVYNVSSEQYNLLYCGDIIYFDNNNSPIFPSLPKE